MTIGFRAAGALSGAAGISAAIDPATCSAMPTGNAAGDLNLLAVGSKGISSGAAPTVSAITGDTYTAPASNSGTGGTGAGGASTGGQTRTTGFYREWQSGDTSPGIDLSAAGNPTIAQLLGFTKDAGKTWAAPTCAVSGDTSAGSPYDPAAAAVVLDLQAGDWLVACHFINDEAGTITVPATYAVAGCTLGTAVNRALVQTTTGNDGAWVVDTIPITAGTASGGPDVTMSATGAIANWAGSTVWFRIRELSSATDLVAADAAHAHTAASPTLTQGHALTAQAAAHAQSAGVPALVQDHTLAAASAAHGQAAGAPVLGQTYELVAAVAAHAHAASSPIFLGEVIPGVLEPGDLPPALLAGAAAVTLNAGVEPVTLIAN